MMSDKLLCFILAFLFAGIVSAYVIYKDCLKKDDPKEPKGETKKPVEHSDTTQPPDENLTVFQIAENIAAAQKKEQAKRHELEARRQQDIQKHCIKHGTKIGETLSAEILNALNGVGEPVMRWKNTDAGRILEIQFYRNITWPNSSWAPAQSNTWQVLIDSIEKIIREKKFSAPIGKISIEIREPDPTSNYHRDSGLTGCQVIVQLPEIPPTDPFTFHAGFRRYNSSDN